MINLEVYLDIYSIKKYQHSFNNTLNKNILKLINDNIKIN